MNVRTTLLTTALVMLGIAAKVNAQLPDPGMEIVEGRTALVITDPQNDFFRSSFVYLAAILDLYSRRIVGWAISKRIDSALCVAALRMALDSRRPGPDCIHHSDRGSQYASADYVDLLGEHGVQISMSAKGNPYDNAFIESFYKTLKYEEVHL